MAFALEDTFEGRSSQPKEVEYALDIVNLSKQFKRQTLTKQGYTTFKSFFLAWLFKREAKERRVTRAINDITLRIPRGASVGIIGKNGTGKSTLLKLISGIYTPDSGSVTVKGRVAALIELGAGFHPDFTGRENLQLGGVLHGLSKKEIEERFDEIVDFAELSEVIDDPVRTYSSGMFMRLGFSLAVHTDPDVLLVDEVLAVGDAAFVAKCKDKIAALRRAGKTLLLVTHDLEAVERWCDEVLWLESGKVRDRGEPRRVIDHYLQFIEKGEDLELMQDRAAEKTELASDPGASKDPNQKQRWGSREIEITSVSMRDENGDEHLVFNPQSKVVLEIKYSVRQAVNDFVFGIGINRIDGLVVHGSNTQIERVPQPVLGQRGTILYSIERLGLLEGQYSLDIAVHREDGYPFDYHKGAVNFKVRSNSPQVGVFEPVHTWQFIREA